MSDNQSQNSAKNDAQELLCLRARVVELEDELAAARSQIAARHPANSPIGPEELRVVFDNYTAGMAFSRDGIIIDANAELSRMLGAPLEDIIGRPILDCVLPEDREIVREHVSQGLTYPYQHRLQRADGSVFPAEAVASVVMSAGSPLRFAVVRDISERKAAEEELDRQRRTLQTILDNLPAGVYVADVPSGRRVMANKWVIDLLGHEAPPDLTKEGLAVEYGAYLRGTDQYYPIEQMPLVRAMSGEVTSVDDMEIRRLDGRRVLIQVFGAPIRNAAGKIVMSVAITQDITDRKRAEEKLLNEQEFLRNLIKAHERDRQLMAYEIHDGLVQYITAAVWHLEAAEHEESISEATKSTLKYAQKLLRQSIADARRVLSGLRPPVLDEQGIVMAIDYLVAEASDPDKLQVVFEHQVHFDRLEPLLEGAIFRIVQESLSNVRKHSSAARATVRLEQRGNRLMLTVRDDGRGFQTGGVPADRFGLQGIRKRAELIGGTAEITSDLGKGTVVTVDLPLIEYNEKLAEANASSGPRTSAS